MKVEESLNVTFNESQPPTNLSPFVNDDVGEEEAIERKVTVDNNNVENKSIEVDEYIKEMLKKFGLEDSKPTKTPMSTEIKLTKDDEAESMDSTNIEFNISLDQFAELTSLQNQGICVYTDSWSLDALKNNLEPNPPYNSNLPPLDDIRAMTHQRVIFKKETKEGIVHKLLYQIKTNELLDHLKPCELVIRENAYVAIGNRDHVQASIALMLYYLENLRETMADHPFDNHYILVPRLMSSLKANQPRRPPLKKPRNVGKGFILVFNVADATDVARSAYDVILTEPGLSVIVNAVLTNRGKY
ncbi:hypothetical protein Tco_1018224 [Tanacetum coccineum]|uniref:Uncharacterized protein n=1 Tax=Tanacetum coccineum TaxID=301880 RepID=A0ABQ5FU43_9ASTR